MLTIWSSFHAGRVGYSDSGILDVGAIKDVDDDIFKQTCLKVFFFFLDVIVFDFLIEYSFWNLEFC